MVNQHQVGLLLHIFGIFCIAGGSIGSVILERRFWKLAYESPNTAKNFLPVLKTYPMIIQVGSLLMILSGLLMLQSLSWMLWGETWFYIKLSLFVLLILNGILVAKPTAGKIAKELNAPAPDKTVLGTLQKKMRVFHTTEYAMMVILLVVTMFRF